MMPRFLAFYSGFDVDSYHRLPLGTWRDLVQHMQRVEGELRQLHGQMRR